MECCKQTMSNFSYQENNILDEKTIHFYCLKCGSHYFKGKLYTAEKWFFYINGVAYNRELHNHIF